MYYYVYIRFGGLRLAVLLVAILLLCGCTKTSVEEPTSSSVAFSIDWSAVEGKTAETAASIYIYPASSSEQTSSNPIVLSGVNSQSAATELPAGTYRVIVHNEDINTIKLRGHNVHTDFEAYADFKDNEQLPIVSKIGNPDYGFIDPVDNLSLLTGSANREVVVTGGSPMSFALRPRTATKSYLFNIKIPSTLGIASVEGVLDGISSTMGMFDAKPKGSALANIVIPLAVREDAEISTFHASGVIKVFGINPDNRAAGSNMLHLHLEPVGGPTPPTPQTASRASADNVFKKDHKIDLTDHFNNFTNTNLIIDVRVVASGPDNPELPDEPQGEVTFEVTVREWIIEDGGTVDME